MKKSSSELTGVLLMNLGTPDEPSVPAVRSFLREFLSDPRVVEIPRLVWLPILYGFILPFRPKKVVEAYQQVWTEKGSPLRVITEEQVAALQEKFASDYPQQKVQVALAMTYGSPSLSEKVVELQQAGVERIVVIPLYPQYSATTTAPIYDQFAQLINDSRNIPNILINKSYARRPKYIEALADSVERHWQSQPRAQKLLFSFHGIPQRCVDLGDPYYDECTFTAEQTAKLLGLDESQWAVSFQSRLGKAQWLQPYTDKLLQQWASSGLKSVDVICPAFAADCIETLEEINVENRGYFLASGGERFSYIPCLNSSPKHIELLAELVLPFLRQ